MNCIKYLLPIILVLASCIKNEESPEYIYVPEIIKNQADLQLSDLFPEFSYTALESNEKCYITRIDKIIMDGDFILIYDRDNKKLLQFNGKGEFIKSFMNRGRGPGEFISITDMDVNEDKELVILRSGEFLDIMRYDGTILNSIRLTRSPMNAKWLNTDVIVLFYPFPVYYFNGGFEITFVNREGAVLKNELPHRIKERPKGMTGRRFIGWNNGSLYYWLNKRDTVYTITQDLEVKPRVVFQHDERAIPIEKTSDVNYVYDFENQYIVNKYAEFEDYTFIHAIYKRHGIRCVINNKLDICGDVIEEYHQFSEHGLLNDVDGGISFWPGQAQQDRGLINTIDPMLLMEVYVHNKKNKVKVDSAKHAHLKSLIDQLDLLSNPIIMRVEK